MTAQEGMASMSRTYRAVAVAAGAALVIELAERLLVASQTGWYSYAPHSGEPALAQIVLMWVWEVAASNIGPCVWACAILLAAQGRRWFWLVGLALAGVISLYGPLYMSNVISSQVASGVDAQQTINLQATYILALSALAPAATLIFTLAPARRRQEVEGVERTSLSQAL